MLSRNGAGDGGRTRLATLGRRASQPEAPASHFVSWIKEEELHFHFLHVGRRPIY